MAKKPIDTLKEKQRKQKILAAVLGVLFLGIAAFQGPKLWKQLHPAAPQASPSPTTTTSTTGTPSLAAPTLGGSQTPSAGSSTAGSSAAPASGAPVADGQLSSFSRFASKDPFAQQLSDSGQAPTSSGSSPSPSGGSTGGGGQSSSSGGGSASAPKPGTAVISVNGTLYTVAVGTDFPSSSSDPTVTPLFHLVSLTAHSAKISIVGGSYSSGAATVTLTENKPVTLMNTADGTRYKLILKPVGTAVAAPSAPTSTTSTTVTVPPPASP